MALRCILVIAVLGAAAPARAGGPEAAAAEQAFDKGRELMKSGLYNEACEAFDQSERLDPQIGTLYNLAGCWEKVGKLASAWTAYREVAQRDTNGTRRKAADEHAKALAPRMPKLVIKISAPVAGMSVMLNGSDVTKLVGIETPMDLGTYAINVRAPGMQGWGGQASLVEEGKLVSVVVPPLLKEGEKPVVKTTTPPPPTKDIVKTQPEPKPLPEGPVQVQPEEGGGNKHGTIAIVTGVAGGVALVGGLAVGAMAKSKLSEAEMLCGADHMCDDQKMTDDANALLASSRTRGNISTGLVAAGVVGLVASGVLWWTGRDSGEPHTAVAPIVTTTSAGLAITGSF